MALRFTWDPRKAAANLRKHRISFIEASTAFGDPLSATIPDPDHSGAEGRFLLVGRTGGGRLVVVAHTEQGDEIRLINARAATRQERKAYEEDQ
jgi:uncharacterized protein